MFVVCLDVDPFERNQQKKTGRKDGDSPLYSSEILSKNCFKVPDKISGRASTSRNTT
jgi:hypothetical protein